MIGLTKAVARELAARNIQVNAVAPGYIETDMTKDLPDDVMQTLIDTIPLRRMGTTEDVASLVSFLASENADYITGQIITVDGGMVM